MGKTRISKYIIWNLLLAVLLSTGIHQILLLGGFARLNPDTAAGERFRTQSLNEEMRNYITTTKDPGEILGLYWLETNFNENKMKETLDSQTFESLKNTWGKRKGYDDYISQCRGIWNELVYFPVPEPVKGTKAGVSFVDSWMYERNYGGKRGHEGTDIMADENQRGYYPIISMTDGTVRHKGWLEQGGWRLGIVSESGTYFYYAHLDSYADIEEGDTVKAGDIIGYMGDSGYSKTEGTTGNFPVHLHVGIYIFHNDVEISVNPYWALRYLENRKIKCVYPQ